MKTPKHHYIRILICGATLLVLPAAFASNAAKFKILDTNNDGRVSRAEYAAGATLMFNRLDTDDDGILTVAEMEACHQLKNTGNSGDKKDEKAVDTNASGQLTRAENEAAADKMFTQLDTDKDGYLSKEECEACQPSVKKDK